MHLEGRHSFNELLIMVYCVHLTTEQVTLSVSLFSVTDKSTNMNGPWENDSQTHLACNPWHRQSHLCHWSKLLHMWWQEGSVWQLCWPRAGNKLPKRVLPNQAFSYDSSWYQNYNVLHLTNLIYLDQKFRDTSGNRTDETLKNVLLSTFSGMFSTIPFLAVTKVS